MFLPFVKLLEKAPNVGLFLLFALVITLPCSCSLDEAMEPESTLTPETTKLGELEEDEAELVCILPIEEPATFPGGKRAWLRFVSEHLQMPQNLQNAQVGSIFLSFLISEAGKVSDVIVYRGLSPESNAAAIEMMSLSPDWIPSKQRGRPVKSRMHIRLAVHLK